jgi:hypothetical protein
MFAAVALVAMLYAPSARSAEPATAQSAPTSQPASGQSASGSASAREMSADMDEAVSRGLSFLAKNQNGDGSIDGGAPTVATTGLAVLAMLASGQAPDEGRLGVTVRTAVDFLLRQVPDDGYVGKVDGSGMRGQAIVTLALAQASGVETDQTRLKRTRAALGRLVDVIQRAQDVTKDTANSGGWGIEPNSTDSDLSVTAWCVLGLRAAENSGIAVDKNRADRAAGFVMACCQAGQGEFASRPGADASASMTAAGVLALSLLDRAQSDAATAGARYLVDHPATQATDTPYDAVYFAAIAAFRSGGSTWSEVWSRTSARLMALHDKDGGWPAGASSQNPGRVYATAMATLTLSTPYRLLPAYQK